MTKIRKIIKGVPSSFVFKNMKLDADKGAGEAKLFVGPKSQIEDINDFFKFNQEYSYRFDKLNLLNYLHEVKMEYVFQHVNKYKDASIETWQKFYTIVENMQNSEMQIHLTEFTDTSRVYIRANEEIFNKLFRKITVPKLTDVEFVRNDDSREMIVLLKVNYDYDKEGNESSEEAITDVINFCTGYESSFSRNRILFGAPGTGKSFTINRDSMELLGKDNEDDYERVTFHPDYSYANFVGTYKPVMVDDSAEIISLASEKEVLSILTDETKSAQEKYDLLYDRFKGDGLTRLPLLLGLYTDESFKTRKVDGSDATGDNSVERNHGRAIRPYVNLSKPSKGKKDISYEYVPGPFMRMYVKALKNSRTDSIKPFLLIIEEINRANVAAVFGDIFQLLDRDDNFVSEYPIQATEDIKKYLAKELGGNPDDYNKIKIPDNMFIWATMNSADQGVFPMDTAFKRRWDFTYLGIDDNDEQIRRKYVVIGSKEQQRIEWNELRKAINEFLAESKINEDKQLGPYFISKSIVVPKDGGTEIDSKKFCDAFKNKVLMYLFDDAAKQKRPSLFEGSAKGQTRYSKICEAFDEQGIGIFNSKIQNAVEVQDLAINGHQLDENGHPITDSEE
ncbi:hypothetical protein [Veillonella montpellierensis]|uniref:hypothetical protein n=1 Tax=Veillonella montpellierensis TaxID=187328 RepID=UPI00068AD2FD|nr:hypothetical protein [Veillonella montpellierensis]